MGFIDFIKNGGLIGTARGFNHKEEGRNYQFQDLHNDIADIKETVDKVKDIGTSASERLMENNPERLLDY